MIWLAKRIKKLWIVLGILLVCIIGLIFYCYVLKDNPTVCKIDWSTFNINDYIGEELDCTPADIQMYGEKYVPMHDCVDVVGTIVDIKADTFDEERVILTICDTEKETDDKLLLCIEDNGEYSIGMTLEVKGHISPYYYLEDDYRGNLDKYAIYQSKGVNICTKEINSKNAISVSEALDIGKKLYEGIRFKVSGEIREEVYYDAFLYTQKNRYYNVYIYLRNQEIFDTGEKVTISGYYYETDSFSVLRDVTIEHSKLRILPTVLKYVLGITMGIVALLLFVSYARSKKNSKGEK